MKSLIKSIRRKVINLPRKLIRIPIMPSLLLRFSKRLLIIIKISSDVSSN